MPANRFKSEAALWIGGEEFLLVFDHAAQGALQSMFGISEWDSKSNRVIERWQMPEVDKILAIALAARHPGRWTAEALAKVDSPVIPRQVAVMALIDAINLSVYGPEGPPKEPPKKTMTSPRKTFSWWPSGRRSVTA